MKKSLLSYKKSLGGVLAGGCFLFLFFSYAFVLPPKRSLDPHHTPSNPQGIGVFYINLDRSTLRRQRLENLLKDLSMPTTRIPGVDGNLIEMNRDILDLRAYREYMGHAPKKGMIGCHLSHMRAWNRFLESSYKYAVIMEDDVVFDPTMLEKALEGVTKLSHWDICSLELSHHGCPLTLASLPGMSTHRLVSYVCHISHGGAYVLTRKAAKVLLERALPVKLPIDHTFTRGWELDLRFTGIEPRLVRQAGLDSDINETQRVTEEPHFLRRKFLRRTMFQISTHLMRFYTGLKQKVLAMMSYSKSHK